MEINIMNKTKKVDQKILIFGGVIAIFVPQNWHVL